MAEIGTQYRPPKATRLHLIQLAKRPPVPELEPIEVRIDRPIDSTTEIDNVIALSAHFATSTDKE